MAFVREWVELHDLNDANVIRIFAIDDCEAWGSRYSLRFDRVCADDLEWSRFDVVLYRAVVPAVEAAIGHASLTDLIEQITWRMAEPSAQYHYNMNYSLARIAAVRLFREGRRDQWSSLFYSGENAMAVVQPWLQGEPAQQTTAKPMRGDDGISGHAPLAWMKREATSPHQIEPLDRKTRQTPTRQGQQNQSATGRAGRRMNMPEASSKAMSNLKSNVSFSRINGRSGGSRSASRATPTRQEQINLRNRPGLSTTERNEVLTGAAIGALAGQVAGGLFGVIVGGGRGRAAGTAQALMD